MTLSSPRRILITGGAGFIGSHLADALLEGGHRVRVLDDLCPQVHGPEAGRPLYLNSEAELRIGDIADPVALRRSLEGIDVVYHLAARVGVGQSMYQVGEYFRVNDLGTANLLQALIDGCRVERLIVASSMSIYGEGLYRAPDGSICDGEERGRDQLRRGEWELRNSEEEILSPIPTPESKRPALSSVYALSKFDQERLCLMIGNAYQIPTVALRLFNVYGTRQALSNPYTGVLAIFASRLLNGRPPMVFEDGLQRRDFVAVSDVVQAFVLALEVPEAAGRVFNVGSGQARTILEITEAVAQALGRSDIKPEITGKYRVGDIRHCFADITLARSVLGYRPCASLQQRLQEMASWLSAAEAKDHVPQANAELASYGLAI